MVSVLVTCNVADAGTTDDIQMTLNYEYIRKSVHDILMKSPQNLIESLAEEIAVKILSHKKSVTVEVDISKPDVWNDCIPGVTIVRKK